MTQGWHVLTFHKVALVMLILRIQKQLQNLKDDSPDGLRLDLFCLYSYRQMSALLATKWKKEKIMCILQVEKLNAL